MKLTIMSVPTVIEKEKEKREKEEEEERKRNFLRKIRYRYNLHGTICEIIMVPAVNPNRLALKYLFQTYNMVFSWLPFSELDELKYD